MSTLTLKHKLPDGRGASSPAPLDAKGKAANKLDIPPPIPTAKATGEQIRASLELGLAEANAGIGEDFEVVQARLRAKFFPSSR